MLLNPKSLKVVGAASTDESRLSLNGILIEPDGSAVGCDGHILVKFTPTSSWDPKEFPSIEGVDPTDGEVKTLCPETNHAENVVCKCTPTDGFIIEKPAEPLKPFILGRDACTQIAKASAAGGRKARALPVLSQIALDAVQTNANGNAVMAVTDLETPQLFKPRKIDADYPDYTKVIPNRDGVKIGFTLEVLEKLLKTLKALDVTVFSMQFASGKDAALDPIRIEADTKDADGRVLAIIMPCRLK